MDTRGWHLLSLWPGIAGDVLKVCHAPEAHAALDLGNDFSPHASHIIMKAVICMGAAIAARTHLVSWQQRMQGSAAVCSTVRRVFNAFPLDASLPTHSRM